MLWGFRLAFLALFVWGTWLEWCSLFIFRHALWLTLKMLILKKIFIFAVGLWELDNIWFQDAKWISPSPFRALPHQSPRGKSHRATPMFPVQRTCRRKDGELGAFIFIYQWRCFTQRAEPRQIQPFESNGAKGDHHLLQHPSPLSFLSALRTNLWLNLIVRWYVIKRAR